MELAGPLRTPLGLAHWKRASSPGKAHKEQEALETTTHLSLGIGLQPEQTAHLQGFSLDDSSPHEVLRVGVHIVQESRAKPQELRGQGGGGQSLLAPRQRYASYPRPLGVEISPTLPMGKHRIRDEILNVRLVPQKPLRPFLTGCHFPMHVGGFSLPALQIS